MNKEKLTKQRKRAQNFSEKEKLLLTDLVLKYKNIIENKRTDGVTSMDKEKCWKTIENIYNSTFSSTEFRSAEVLKSCWDNLKKNTRKFFADERMQLYKTGGRSYEPRSNIVMERVRDIIRSSVDGITSTFDSDAIEGQNKNVHKISTNKNSCKTLTDTAEEWLDNNDNESTYQDKDVLYYLKTHTGAVTKDLFDQVSDTYEPLNYDKENENDGESDINENNSIHAPTKKNIQKPQEQERDVQNISAVQTLQRRISTPLQAKTNILNNQHDSRKLNRQNKPYKKREDTNSSRMLQIDILTESKIKLAECMTEDFKTKSEVEMQILNARLKKKELEIQILHKELLLQEHRLQKELQQNSSYNTSEK